MNRNNPMRFALRDRTIDLSDIPVTRVEVRPGEGNVYVWWDDDE
jgi:hypothetical protein